MTIEKQQSHRIVVLIPDLQQFLVFLVQTAALFYCGLSLKRIKMKTSEPNKPIQFMITRLF